MFLRLGPAPPRVVLPTLPLPSLRPLLSLIPSAAGHGYVTAFVIKVVIGQLNATGALRSDIGPVKGTDTITPTHS
ncbi:hypothetical protein F5888DRAFT_1665870 [Russula emetica]|nr:hypothetical protein F5888DRAFT_1665870 [Russula emetica]